MRPSLPEPHRPAMRKGLQGCEATFKDEPALLYAKAKYFRLKRNYKEAARLLEQAPKDDSALVVPADWWAEARIVSRNLAEAGKAKAAYALAVRPWPLTDADRVEAEFHAGWYALRRLKDPGLAEPHFAAILKVSDRPVALARGFYWLGRTEELRDKGTGRRLLPARGDLYRHLLWPACRRQTRTETLRFTEPGATAADEAALTAVRKSAPRSSMKRPAIPPRDPHHPRCGWCLCQNRRFRAVVAPGRARRRPGRGARNRQDDLWPRLQPADPGRACGAIPDTADIEGSGKALAYAVARQESAFNPRAVSPANAFGLLQLLPGNRQARCRPARDGFSSSPPCSTIRATNATLGAHYLGEQIDAYDGSYILTHAAYNAGRSASMNGSNAMAIRAAARSTTSSTGSNASPSPKRAPMFTASWRIIRSTRPGSAETANLEKDLTGGRRR